MATLITIIFLVSVVGLLVSGIVCVFSTNDTKKSVPYSINYYGERDYR
jgi:hypothetical protein